MANPYSFCQLIFAEQRQAQCEVVGIEQTQALSWAGK